MQKILELKIPPLAVLLIVALLMWLCKQSFPFLSLNFSFQIHVAAVIFVSGCGLVITAGHAFHRAGTTVNPMKPETSSTLIKEGVYRFSRNPIYLGLTMILISWGIYLNNLLSLLLVIIFVIYMNQFQIKPEERALQKLFGACFEQYKQQVRRWL